MTDEFWRPARGMKRCIACQNEDEAARRRALYRDDPVLRERLKRRSRAYESACPRTLKRRLRHEAMMADPLLLAKGRQSAAQRQREYRARQKAKRHEGLQTAGGEDYADGGRAPRLRAFQPGSPAAVRSDGVSITPTHETARLPLTPVVAGPSYPAESAHG